jgi:dihydroflavonol-4-reductase
MAETVLVTGGTGFVAGWCIVELLRRGYAVRTTVRSLSKEARVRAAISTSIDSGDRLTCSAADLTSDAGWNEAMAGCDYVLHVASPLGADSPKDPNALIVPARDGALRVLRAATSAAVKRVVLTSSCAAASPPLASEDSLSDESVWTDTDDRSLSAYRKSKTLAERDAWEFMNGYHGPTTLTTILPAAVFGPVLTAENPGSVQVIGRLLKGRVPGNPRLGFDVVDVRDTADLHLRAMTAPEAAGQRFIAAGEFMWMTDVSKTLRAELGKAAGKVPIRSMPDFVLRFMSLFDHALRAVTPGLGRKHRHTSEKAQRLLGWRPRPAAVTVVDCAKSLLAQGMA